MVCQAWLAFHIIWSVTGWFDFVWWIMCDMWSKELILCVYSIESFSFVWHEVGTPPCKWDDNFAFCVTDVITVYPSEVVWACIVSWGYPDNIVRVKNKKGAPPLNFLHWPANEQVTCCASVPDCRLLFLGSTSGVLSVFNTKFNQDKVNIMNTFIFKDINFQFLHFWYFIETWNSLFSI